MPRLSLSEHELTILRASLTIAIGGNCIPDWEFEPLIGCSRSNALRSVEAGIRKMQASGERPSGQVVERMLLLLNMALGASHSDGMPGLANVDELEGLVAWLSSHEAPRSARTSGIGLRSDAAALTGAMRRKRSA